MSEKKKSKKKKIHNITKLLKKLNSIMGVLYLKLRDP